MAATTSTTAENLSDDTVTENQSSGADDTVMEKTADTTTAPGGSVHEAGTTTETDASSAAAAAAVTPPRRTPLQTAILMFALCMAVFLAALDSVIIVTALPTIARELGATDSGYAWVAAAYLLASAAVVPFWGKVSDIFGRKPILMVANVVFLVGSIVAALAHTLTMLIAGRAVQGLGAGGLIALVNITVGDLFSPRERGMYFSAVGAVWGLASGTGTLIGGAFTQNATWRWCFWINLPISALSLAILTFFLKIHTPKTPFVHGLLAIDWLGTITFTGATIMLLFGLEFGGITYPWSSATVICLIIFGLVGYGVFVGVEGYLARYPLMPYRLFDHSSVGFVYICDSSHGVCFGAVAYFLPLYFQSTLDASPIQSGVWMLATTLPLAVFTVGTGIAIKKTGRYIEIIRGCMAFMVLSFGLLISLPSYRSWPKLILYQLLVAFGTAPNLQALLIALQALVRQADVAVGTAMFGFIRQMSVGIGVVVGQVIFQGRMKTHFDDLVAVGVPPELATELARGSTIATGHLAASLSAAQRFVFRTALADSFSKVWICMCAIAAVGLLASFGVRQIVLSHQHVETKTGLEAEEAKTEERRRKPGDGTKETV